MVTRVVLVLASARPASLGRHLTDLVLDTLVTAGAEVEVQDLLQDGFDPVLRLDPDQEHALCPDPQQDPLAARYAQAVSTSDAIVIIHPVWWFAPPAILKGWVDRILVHGVAIEQAEGGPPRGLLGGKQCLVLQTFNASAHIDRIVFRALSFAFWKRVIGLATDLKRVRRLALYNVDEIEPRRLARFEERVRRAALGVLPGA